MTQRNNERDPRRLSIYRQVLITQPQERAYFDIYGSEEQRRKIIADLRSNEMAPEYVCQAVAFAYLLGIREARENVGATVVNYSTYVRENIVPPAGYVSQRSSIVSSASYFQQLYPEILRLSPDEQDIFAEKLWGDVNKGNLRASPRLAMHLATGLPQAKDNHLAAYFLSDAYWVQALEDHNNRKTIIKDKDSISSIEELIEFALNAASLRLLRQNTFDQQGRLTSAQLDAMRSYADERYSIAKRLSLLFSLAVLEAKSCHIDSQGKIVLSFEDSPFVPIEQEIPRIRRVSL